MLTQTGGPNFGIVAEFGVKLHPQRPDVYSVSLAFPMSQIPAIVTTINEWRTTQKPTEILMMICMSHSGTGLVAIRALLDGDEEEGNRRFGPFVKLGPISTQLKQVPFTKRGDLEGLAAQRGKKLHMGGYFDSFDPQTVVKAVENWSENISTKAPASYFMWEFYHYGKLSTVAADATAYFHRKPTPVVLCGILWDDEAFTLDTARTAALESLHIATSSSSPSLQDSVGYPNYADGHADGGESAARRLFGTNYARLQDVKKKYDPEQVWNQWYAIGPSLSPS